MKKAALSLGGLNQCVTESLLHFLRNLEDLQNGDGFLEPANRVDKRSRLANVADSELFTRLLIRLRPAFPLGLGGTRIRIWLTLVGFVSHAVCTVVEVILDCGDPRRSTGLPSVLFCHSSHPVDPKNPVSELHRLDVLGTRAFRTLAFREGHLLAFV